MLLELREERDAIEEAILVLERLARSSGPKRRGRPPKWLSDGAAPRPVPKRWTLSPQTRARIAAAQRARWVKRKRARSTEGE